MSDQGFGSELFDLLRTMEMPNGDYAIFGSGPLLVRGIIESVNDLDVICSDLAWIHACRIGTLVDLEEEGIQIVSTHDGSITFGRAWGYGSFDLADLIATADTINGLPFVRMEHVIEYKRIANRPKDLDHLARIKQFDGNSQLR